MKTHIACKSLLLIIALLTSQLGNAFVFAAPMQDCGMDMSLDAHFGAANKMAEAMAKTMTENMEEKTADQMDCCDMALAVSCCDGDCQCSSVVSAIVFVSHRGFNKVAKTHLQPSIPLVTQPLTPFLHQPKRPPIKNIS